MKIYRVFTSLLMGAVLLSGCTYSEPIEVEDQPLEETEEVNEYVEFTSEDGSVQFTIANNGSFPEDTVDRIQSETLHAYKKIMDLTDQSINGNKEVMIQLKSGKGQSHYYNGVIDLYNIGEHNEFLVHELAHALLGYDFKDAGYFTLDGLAMYLEKQITNKDPGIYFNHTSHELMSFLKEKDVEIPTEELIDPENSIKINDYRNEGIDRWLFYSKADSISTFLIEEYGMEKFMKIYNQEDLLTKVEQTYGKPFRELEQEWIRFLGKINQNESATASIPVGLLKKIDEYEYKEK